MSASAGLAAFISGLVGVAVVVSVGAGVAACSVAGELQPENSKEQETKATRNLGVTATGYWWLFFFGGSCWFVLCDNLGLNRLAQRIF